SWAYDCGSKRPTQVKAMVHRFAGELSSVASDADPIKLLAISHFDDDHVHGVEALLQERRVEHLALPYMPLRQSLFNATGRAGGAMSSTTAAFQFDPPAWLLARGLGERVDQIVLVRGGSDAADGDSQVMFPEPPLPDRGVRAEEGAAANFRLLNSEPDGPAIHLQSHSNSVKLVNQLPLEFVFFNSTLPNEVAPSSGLSLDVVRAALQKLLQGLGINSGGRLPTRVWRPALRSFYDRHFGATGPARNNISLCMMIRPQSRSWNFFPCSSEAGCVPASRQTLLLTGDLAMSSSEISAMKSHFGPRWDELAVVQVPHHGSKHSWVKGNAASIGPVAFVQCIPDTCRLGRHPHASVSADLSAHPVFAADYQRGVIQQFMV
ncbi:hypothetical protein, partial [Ramlibacter sp.]|uniref:hypothetical protein n=1 Tax=Ramlibacter sp. TaxID=1917967 RepID=UPI003D0CA59C